MYLMLRVGLLVLALVLADGRRVKRQAIPCIGFGNVQGACIALRDCGVLADRIRQDPRNNRLIQEIRRTSQVCTNARTQVCCPGAVPQVSTSINTPAPAQTAGGLSTAITLPTFADGCGVLRKTVSFQKIIGGRPPSIGTWPWIALLGYGTSSGVSFNCGGTIITKRHVLTAAHCIRTNLLLVRFGEHDLSTDTETPHVDINVRKAVRHSDFDKNINAGRNDIGMVYMEQDIPFTVLDLIKPVCLPTDDSLKNNSFVGFNPFVAGWGRISGRTQETATVLQQLQVRVYETTDCDNVYRRAGQLSQSETIDNAFLCSGDLTGGKDTCQGDSGGPLVAAHDIGGSRHRIILIGIISSGIGCGIPNAPSLYTRTSYYLDWIQQKVAEPF